MEGWDEIFHQKNEFLVHCFNSVISGTEYLWAMSFDFNIQNINVKSLFTNSQILLIFQKRNNWMLIKLSGKLSGSV